MEHYTENPGSTIGARIAFYRRKKNMTQEKLAAELGITNQAVSKWELDLNCPDILSLPRLADLLGVTIDSLFGREAAPVPTAAPGPELPWPDDGQLRAVLFRGRQPCVRKDGAEQAACSRIEFAYDGPALDVHSDFSIVCRQEIRGGAYAGTSIQCGDIGGSAQAGTSISGGGIAGGARAGSHIECARVEGNVSAGSHVTCGDVAGDVSAGGKVDCGDVGGSVTAVGKVVCGQVKGRKTSLL